jgi:hypothetical protein
MRPPTNPTVVAELEASDYLHVFYPIQRDWSGPIDANLANRDANRQILDDMRAWLDFAKLEYGVVEYYNQSAYGAVAVTDVAFLENNYEILAACRT